MAARWPLASSTWLVNNAAHSCNTRSVICLQMRNGVEPCSLSQVKTWGRRPPVSSVSTMAPRSAGMTSRINSKRGRSRPMRPRMAFMALTTFNKPWTSRAMRAGDSRTEANFSGSRQRASSRRSWTTLCGIMDASRCMRSALAGVAFKDTPNSCSTGRVRPAVLDHPTAPRCMLSI